jgi:site-specific DNA-methyltransferase (adenine-specific)
MKRKSQAVEKDRAQFADRNQLKKLLSRYEIAQFKNSIIVHADCFDVLRQFPECCIDGVVTDPPYGVKEYEEHELKRMHSGGTGIWRLPPTFDGNQRSPLPRFTALNARERKVLEDFFTKWGRLVLRILKPGGHMLIASNAFMSQLVFQSLVAAGLEFRGEVVRLVQTLRGGDRPKLGEEEFPEVSSLPRGGYEPWGLFRKALPKGQTVRDCLRTLGTGGLRRKAGGLPFSDVIQSERTPQRERLIANHPSLKPQSLMRQLVRTILPLGRGIVLDPFMGSGSTVAAAEALGYQCIGIERYADYFKLAQNAIPRLVKSTAGLKGGTIHHKDQLGFNL